MGEYNRCVVDVAIDGYWSRIAPRPDLGFGDAKVLSENETGDSAYCFKFLPQR